MNTNALLVAAPAPGGEMDENNNDEELENMQILGDDEPPEGDSVFDVGPSGDDQPAPVRPTPSLEDDPPPLFKETPAPSGDEWDEDDEWDDVGDDKSKNWTEPVDDWATVTGATPRWQDAEADLPPLQPVEAVGGAEVVDDFFGYEDEGRSVISDEDLAPIDPTSPSPVMSDEQAAFAAAEPTDRDMVTAIISGVGLAVVAAICFFVGPAATVILATALLTLAAAEFANSMRAHGYNPPILLLISAVAFMSLATYYKGDQAIPLVLFLTVVFAAFWYLAEVSIDRPVHNLGITMLGVVWIGVLGSFAGVMLRASGDTGMLLAAVVATVAYDVGALIVGTTAGRQPLNAASPGKTIEGLVGGCIAAVAATTIIIGLFEIGPFGDSATGGGLIDAFIIGVVAAVVAPVGDLFESLLKRDLGIKDMGSIIPGHGGLLDRFDALLFVLPATYYVGRVIL